MSGTDHGQCLTEDTLTEYLEGGLDPAVKAASEVHLIFCDDCRGRLGFFMHVLDEDIKEEETQAIQSITAEWERQKQRHNLPQRSGTLPAWLFGFVAVTAALLIGLLSVGAFLNRQAEPRTAGEIIQLLLAQQRPFESRMSNEPHLPVFRTRGSEGPGVAYGLVAGQLTRLSADAHQMGRFYLLQKDFAHAIPYLEIAEKEVGANADVHSDLGVAYLESGDPALMEKAGEEFDHAVKLDAKFAPAVFNQSVFLERKNATAEAAARWKRYLALDGTSEWATEARARLQGLSR